MTIKTLSLVVICSLALGCTQTASSSSTPTPAEAKKFLDATNATLLKLGIDASRAGWVQQTFITDDTEVLSAQANQLANEAGVRFAKEATKYDRLDLPADQRREITVLKTALVLAPPSDPKESDELAKIMARLESTYGKGKWCTDASKPDT